MIRKIFYWFKENQTISVFILLIIIGIIGYCSSIPGTSLGLSINYMDVVYHFAIFSAFTFFLLLTISEKETDSKEILFVIGILLITAILDEIHQIIIPLRDANIKDVLTDFLGGIFAVLLFIGLNKKQK